MNEPLVSVILPVFNAGRLLEEAIESILNQTIQNLELIIINDGSTDDSLDIIKTFAHKDKRIRFISRPNKGLVFTLNELVKLANGRYIARQDQDDISLPARLEKQIAFLRRNPDVSMVGTNIMVIDSRGKRVSQKVANVDFLTHPNDLKLAEVFSNQFAHGSIVIKRSSIKSDRYDPDYSYAEDYDFWSRLSRRSKLANL
jgi:glycosyltransferase involved in cell wall biosynthesis